MQMKSTYLFTVLFSFISYAQPVKKAGVISYNESFGGTETNLYELYFCNQESVYERIFQPNPGSVQTIMGFVEPQIKSIYHTNTKSRQIIFKEGIAFKAVTALEEVTIDWKIEDKTKKIGGFNCQKATALFKGNHYTAWFTSEIPVSFGPWKFYGLPGLILECYDSTNFFKVVVTKINFDSGCDLVVEKIRMADFDKPVSMKKYVELKRNENEEIFNFYQSISPRDSYLSVETDYTGFIREPLK